MPRGSVLKLVLRLLRVGHQEARDPIPAWIRPVLPLPGACIYAVSRKK
jgi:hypothetical protein